MTLVKNLIVAGSIVFAGLLPQAAVAQSSFDWSGFYAGLYGGYGFGANESQDIFCETNPCPFPAGPMNSRFEANYGLSGAQLGVQAGFDYAIDEKYVVGIVGSIGYSGIRGNGNYVYTDGSNGNSFDQPDTSSLAFDWEGSVRAKFGMQMDRFLPYITAGIAVGHANYTATRFFTSPEPVFSSSPTFVGAVIGAGVAYAVSDQVVLHGEALYTHYAPQVVHMVDPLDPNNSTDTRLNPSTFAIRGGISFKF